MSKAFLRAVCNWPHHCHAWTSALDERHGHKGWLLRLSACVQVDAPIFHRISQQGISDYFWCRQWRAPTSSQALTAPARLYVQKQERASWAQGEACGVNSPCAEQVRILALLSPEGDIWGVPLFFLTSHITKPQLTFTVACLWGIKHWCTPSGMHTSCEQGSQLTDRAAD